MKNNCPDNQHNKNLFSTMYCIVLFINHIFASSSTLKNNIKIKTMKTLPNLLGLLLVILLMNTSNAANVAPVQRENNTDKVERPNTTSGNRTKPGQILVVNLPEVEIIATRPDTHILKGYYVDGTLILSVDLPSIEIIGQRLPGTKVKTALINGELMILAELPLIEITESLPVNKLQLATKSGMPVITLNEVLIVANAITEAELMAAEVERLKILAVDFSSDKDDQEISSVIAVETSESTFENANSEWFYLTLKKCGIHINGEQMYSIVSQSRIVASDAIKNQMIQLVNR